MRVFRLTVVLISFVALTNAQAGVAGVSQTIPTWLSLFLCGSLIAGTTLHRRSKTRRSKKDLA